MRRKFWEILFGWRTNDFYEVCRPVNLALTVYGDGGDDDDNCKNDYADDDANCTYDYADDADLFEVPLHNPIDQKAPLQ